MQNKETNKIYLLEGILYFLEKLSDINYRIATHEGDAKKRLASEAIKILILPSNEAPNQYKEEFSKLRKIIEETIKNMPSPGMTPTGLTGISNRTAIKYIKLLIDVEVSLHDY